MSAAVERYAVELETEYRRRRRHAPAAPTLLFNAWLAGARPEYRWDAAHFRLMHAALDEVTAGTLRRLVLSVSVRHGKTETIIGYAVHRLERDPRLQILVGSHSHDQAATVSREIRRLARTRGVLMSEDRDAAHQWETAAGGGVRAYGANAGVASANAGLILIDDPIGKRDEAESQLQRDKVWDWFTNDILARCVPETAVVLSHPRWHQDDPIGRIKDRQAARWRIVDLPGRAEPGDPLGRAEGAPLWPERLGEDWLVEKRDELGEYGFASLVQGRPRPREGGMFQWAWWQLLDAVPTQGPMVRYWDTAGTEAKGHGHDPDYTAGALLCRMTDGRTAVVDVARFRHSLARRDAEILDVARADVARWPGRVTWWFETEAGIQGAERTAAIVRAAQAAGLPVYTEHPTGSKIGRAQPLASATEAGNVLLCPGAWRDAFRAEAADFPTGAHDDQCLIGETEVVTPWGPVRLDGIAPGDTVLGRTGWVKVLAAGRTGRHSVVTNGTLTGTARHPVFADGGWVPLAQVESTMVILALCAQSTDVLAPSSPAVSARCTTSGSIAVPPSVPPPRCEPCPSRLVQWRDVAGCPTRSGSAQSITRDGSGTATRRLFTPPNAGPCASNRLSSEALSFGATLIPLTPHTVATSSRAGSTFSAAWSHFIESCGRRITGPFLRGWKCITSTAIRETTPNATSRFARALSRIRNTALSAASLATHRANSRTSPRFAPWPLRGTSRQPAAPGTANTRDERDSVRDVFNLTTEDGTYFANGVLVHNCDAADGAFAKLAVPTAWTPVRVAF